MPLSLRNWFIGLDQAQQAKFRSKSIKCASNLTWFFIVDENHGEQMVAASMVYNVRIYIFIV